MAKKEAEWVVAGSTESHSTINPINAFMEVHFTEAIQNCKKELFRLGAGDPTVFGNLPPHPAVGKALQDALEHAGSDNLRYHHSSGWEPARAAVAEHLTRHAPENRKLSYKDVFLTPGAHCALEICFRVLAEPGQTILLSSPCYTIYKCFTGAIGLKVQHYNLLSEREWEVDLGHLEEQLRAGGRSIAAVVINNPSNPCGSVYSKQHLLDILSVIERYRVPIVADEVYLDMVYKGHEYHPIGSLTSKVPVLSCASVSKKYLVPGWRLGWVAAFDNDQKSLSKEILPGIARMLMKVLVPSSLFQAALPDVIKNVPDSHIRGIMEIFETNADLCYSILKEIEGLTPIKPAGSMYIMVKMSQKNFPEFADDVAFMKRLIVEQGVMGFPGSIFQYPWSMRVTLIMPKDKLREACDRIAHFCRDHFKP